MPAYNVADFIDEAIQSVTSQSVGDWELIVVNDGSTDDTRAIAARRAAADPRIRVLDMPRPSGSAYMPRREGIMQARGRFVAPLDADDRVEPDYLERLLERQRATGAEIVYPVMHDLADRRRLLDTPRDLFDRTLPGREWVRYTLDGWRIGCNGGVICRDLYLRVFEAYPDHPAYSCADELLTRRLLLTARSAAICDTPYLYRANPESITRKASGRLFDYLMNDRALIDLTRDRFGADSEEYRRAQRQAMMGIFDAMRLLNRRRFGKDDRRRALRLIDDLRGALEPDLLRPTVGGKYMTLLSWPTESAALALKAGDLLRRYLPGTDGLVRRSVRKMRRSTLSLLGSLDARRGLPARDSADAELTARLYRPGCAATAPEKSGVTVMLDGEIYHGGLTDRMRGILTAYSECRRRGIPFHICWTEPFPLTDYLLPASFDWRTDPAEICRDTRYARPVVADDMTDREARMRIRAALSGYLREGMAGRQLHLYTNADYARGDYAALYREVFRPSPTLAEATARHRAALGEGYWSVTTRFLTLLGDFDDWITEPLPPEEQLRLMERVADEFRRLAERIPADCRILLTSDSRRFLDYMKGVDERVYVVEGDVRNIDLNREPACEAWLKTFIDQQLIMGATHVVRMRTGRMYATGFPRFAAEIGGGVFMDVSF